MVRNSVHWRPLDKTYVDAGLFPDFQYFEWEESPHETAMRMVGQTREILSESDDLSGLVGVYAEKNDVSAYMIARRLAADSNGALMLVLNNDGNLMLAERKNFSAEWHPNLMFGGFEFTIAADFTDDLA